MTAEDTRVPVTLFPGFLGSGKTTLLNHLIRDPEAGRVAVIMNEFGDVGLDHDLIDAALVGEESTFVPHQWEDLPDRFPGWRRAPEAA